MAPWSLVPRLPDAERAISGLTLLAFPQASIDMPLDANGQALIALPVPYQTFFCNASLFMQHIHLDPASSAQVPVVATNGLQWMVGQ